VEQEDEGFIPGALYDQIKKYIPIVSVEAVIVIDGALLFLRRKNEPAKGQWWFAGGRIHRGESLEDTLHREVKEETGLQITSHKFIGAYSRVFPERHDITLAYLCQAKGTLTLDSEHSEYMLSKSLPEGIHPYLLKTIQDSHWQTSLN